MDVSFDKYGIWQTDSRFSPTESIYEVSFSSIMVDQTNYTSMITELQRYVQQTTSISASFNLGTLYAGLSSITWTFQSSDFGSGKTNATVAMVANTNPSTILNGFVLSTASMISANASNSLKCRNLKPRVNKADGGSITWSYMDITRTAGSKTPYLNFGCDQIIDTELMDVSSYFNSENPIVNVLTSTVSFNASQIQDLIYQVDTTSMLVAVAVNMGFLPLSQLSLTPSSAAMGVPMNAYLFAKYPQMDVLLCKENLYENTYGNNTKKFPLCYVRLMLQGGLFVIVLPTMVGIASKPNIELDMGRCICPVPEELKSVCSQPNFNFGLVGINIPPDFDTYGADAKTHQYEVMINKTAAYVNNLDFGSLGKYNTFMTKVYNVSAYLTRLNASDTSPHLEEIQDNFDGLFSFCDKECFVMPYYFFGVTTAIGSNSLSLSNAACAVPNSPQSIFPTNEAWENLKNTPPTALTYDYYKCKNTITSSLQTAVGIANGIALSITSVLGMVLLPLIVFLMHTYGYLDMPRHSFHYTAEDKQAAVDELALQIMHIRDGDKNCIKAGGHLEMLTIELLDAAKLNLNRRQVGSSSVEEIHDSENDIQPSRGASIFLDRQPKKLTGDTAISTTNVENPLFARNKTNFQNDL